MFYRSKISGSQRSTSPDIIKQGRSNMCNLHSHQMTERTKKCTNPKRTRGNNRKWGTATKLKKWKRSGPLSDKLKRPGNLTHFLTLTETGWPGLKAQGFLEYGRPHDHPSAPSGPFLHQNIYFLKKCEQQKVGMKHHGQEGRGESRTTCIGNGQGRLF